MRLRGLLLIVLATAGGFADEAPPKRVVGYFIEWGVYGRNFHVKDVETSGAAARLTHLLYAFADIGEDLRCRLGEVYPDIDKFYDAASSVDGVADTWDAGALRGSFNQLRKLKVLHPHLKVLIAIGGWTWSGRFSDAALTTESREAFVASAIDIFIKGNFAPGISAPGIFDGIDIDWEYPAVPGATNNYRPEDTVNYTLLLEEFRRQLDEQGDLDGRSYLLSVAGPMGPDKIAKIEIDAVSEAVDFINLMAYDFHGTWEAATHHHAPLFEPDGDPSAGQGLCADAGVRAYLAAGAAAEKLNLGVPFYGHGWKGVPAGPNGDGLFQTGTGAAPATWEAGTEDYEVLEALSATCVKHRDPTALVPWLYCPETQVFWSYDDPESVTAKMEYVVENGLGGAMFWELSGDDPEGSLVSAMADGLSGSPPATFALTVVNGTGSGDYTPGTTVPIVAGPAAPGMVFDRWTGADVADEEASSTTLVMPAADTRVTATYAEAVLVLTVGALAGKTSPAAGADRCALSCAIPFGGDLADLAGVAVTLHVCGQDVPFTFDGRGRAASESGRLSAKASKKAPGTLLLKAKLAGLTLSPGLSAAGLDLGVAGKGVPAEVPVSLRLAGRLHGPSKVGILYSGRADGRGKFKGPEIRED